MHITEFYEEYITEPGYYELEVVMPDCRKCKVDITTQYIQGMNHHEMEIFDLHHGEEMPEHVVKHWCVDVSDWLVEAWEEEMKR